MFEDLRTRPARRFSTLTAVAAACLLLSALASTAAAESPVATQAGSESGVTQVVTGEVMRAYAEVGVVDGVDDHHAGAEALEDGDRPGLLTWIATDDGRDVRVHTEDLADVPGGARVRVSLGAYLPPAAGDPEAAENTGFEVLQAAMLSEPAPDSTTQGPTAEGRVAQADPPANKVIVALVEPVGHFRDTTTATEMTSIVEAGASVFWKGQTNGQLSFDVVAEHGWVTTEATCENFPDMWDEVATAVNFTGGPGEHLVMYVAPGGTEDCYVGLGTVGKGLRSGGISQVRVANTAIVAHELGHNVGLEHSDGLQCDGVSDGAARVGDEPGDGCVLEPYRDWYDVMGVSWQHLGSLSGFQSSKLGVLPPGSVIERTTPSTVTLNPISARTATMPRVLRLVDGGYEYSIEYRPASGQDAWLTGNGRSLEAGVLVRRSDPDAFYPGGSVLLDATPSAAVDPHTVDPDDWQQVLPEGGTFSTIAGTYTVRVDSTGSANALLSLAVDDVWPTTPAPPTLGTASRFMPVTPTRVLNRTAVGAKSMRTITVPNAPAGATAVVLNVTAAGPTAATYVSVCPGGTALATCSKTSNFNPAQGKDTAGLVTARLGPNNTVNLYNYAGTVGLLADVQGWFAPNASTTFTAKPPTRALGKTMFGPGDLGSFVVPDVPVGARAVVLNVTAVAPSTPTYVSVCPGGTSTADCRKSSNVNAAPGANVANLVVVPLGIGAALNEVNLFNYAGSVGLIVDVQGWFGSGTGSSYRAVTPTRLLANTPVAGGTARTLHLRDAPTGATAVVLNVTAATPTASTYVSVCPGGTPVATCRTTSNLNPPAARNVANLVMVKLGPNDTVTLYNNSGTAGLIADLQGWYVP